MNRDLATAPKRHPLRRDYNRFGRIAKVHIRVLELANRHADLVPLAFLNTDSNMMLAPTEKFSTGCRSPALGFLQLP
jgi:hypothetical protein